jgi:hypothetical protein
MGKLDEAGKARARSRPSSGTRTGRRSNSQAAAD